jgi:hypothetical protein
MRAGIRRVSILPSSNSYSFIKKAEDFSISVTSTLLGLELLFLLLLSAVALIDLCEFEQLFSKAICYVFTLE